MDFKITIENILKKFKEKKVRYALMGGFALGALGKSRATVDLDFLVLKDDMPDVNRIMIDLGYELRFNSENVSQYISPLKVFGEVDFIHAFRPTSIGMIERSLEMEIFDGGLKIRVLNPEDIIGLKLQAIANDESRKAFDLNDIESLMALYKRRLDWNLVNEYFSLFDFKDLFNELKKKYDAD